MTKVIKPILGTRDEGIFDYTRSRLYTMFQPIQEVDDRKESDITAYFLNPVIDTVVIPALLVDTVIHLTNALATLLSAARDWSFHQPGKRDVLPNSTKSELEKAKVYFLNAIASLVSVINPILSALSLITRPIASVFKAASDACSECASSSESAYTI